MAFQIAEITPEFAQRPLPKRSEEDWAAMRHSFLDRGYVECSITGCTRLVSPAIIRRLAADTLVAICPDRQGRHAGRLGPTRLQAVMRAYAQATRSARRRQQRPRRPATRRSSWHHGRLGSTRGNRSSYCSGVIATIALVVSIISLVLSAVALWTTHLSPFRLRVLTGTPLLRLDKVTPAMRSEPAGNTWWMPSFSMGISLYNLGARQGTITEVALIANLSNDKGSATFNFPAQWIVDPAYEYASFGVRDRKTWITNAVSRDFYPLLLRGHSETSMHLAFEGETWPDIFDATGIVSLQVTWDGRTRTFHRWKVALDEELWDGGALFLDSAKSKRPVSGS